MDPNPEFIRILLIIPGALAGLTFHEAAHAFVAWRLGDPTAKRMGRLTLNPIRHLDLFGTIMIFLVHFGWAKPVPVNPSYFRSPKRDNLLVALAGPFTNFLLAALFGLAVRLLDVQAGGGVSPSSGSILYVILFYGVLINVALGIFNLLPIPPLDGSRLVHFFVPDRYEAHYRRFSRVAGFAFLGLIVFGIATGNSIIGAILGPPVTFFLRLFAGV